MGDPLDSSVPLVLFNKDTQTHLVAVDLICRGAHGGTSGDNNNMCNACHPNELNRYFVPCFYGLSQRAHGSREMSEYERMRQENIRRNNEYFAGLNLSQVLTMNFTCDLG